MGIASSGGSVGNILLPQFTLRCVDALGWRGAFVLLGGICLQGVIGSVLLYSRKSSNTKHADTQTMPGMSYFIVSVVVPIQVHVLKMVIY